MEISGKSPELHMYANMVQEYDLYDEEAFNVWELLYNRMMETFPNRADKDYLTGIEKIGFSSDKIPVFDEMNAKLKEATGWEVIVVPGLIPDKPFFELLKSKKFPATTWLRKMRELDYLEEPDMFHDIFGHVPLLMNRDFVGFLEHLSRIALRHIENPHAIELVARLYWYTVEFGLIKTDEGVRVYGAGILSSKGETIYCLEKETTLVHYDYDVKRIMRTPFIKDKFQERYFLIESYRDLYQSVLEIESVLEDELQIYEVKKQAELEDAQKNI